ncbi:MAG: hypothetical protein ACK4WH_02460 [Phycisphaerales bacterium]
MPFDFFDFGSARLESRLARIERKLDLLLSHLGIAEPAPDHADIRELARSGRKIEAIKLYRERTGAGLAEAKAAVDAM